VTGPGGFPFIRCDNYVPQFDGVPQHAAGTSVRYGVSPDAAGSSSVLYRKHGYPSTAPEPEESSTAKEQKPSSSAGRDKKKSSSNYMYAIAGLSLAAVVAAILYTILTRLRPSLAR